MRPSLPDLTTLLPSWELALRAERKSPATLKSYGDGVRAFLRWCDTSGTEPELTRLNAQAFIADLLDGGAQAATAAARLKGLRRYSAWLASEGEIGEDQLAAMRSPQRDTKVVHALTDDQIKRLLKACAGNSLKDRRDMAIMRVMLETGARASEVVGLQTTDVDLGRGLVEIRRGKGGKGRVVPIGTQTALALDRYLRSRRALGLDDTGPLWVGKGGSFGYSGLDGALKQRAAAAGIPGFHAHLLRHTFATRWKRAAGSDDGLMSIAGWSSRTMIDRYAGAAAADRAMDEARRLGLGEFL